MPAAVVIAATEIGGQPIRLGQVAAGGIGVTGAGGQDRRTQMQRPGYPQRLPIITAAARIDLVSDAIQQPLADVIGTGLQHRVRSRPGRQRAHQWIRGTFGRPCGAILDHRRQVGVPDLVGDRMGREQQHRQQPEPTFAVRPGRLMRRGCRLHQQLR
ncbi:hypothetical protein [Fodinicola acaciae]|uniref:hypothetical protein n=1 Tax=Fodinicola acaciae TaxID=2681555 RepID=UPI0013D55770